MTGIILAAGNGYRLKKSLGEDCCKVLKRVNGIHLIEFALDNLIESEVDKTFIVVGKDGDLIKSVIGEEYKGLKITYIYQSEQIGLINAFMQALNHIELDDVILQLADEIFIGFESDYIKSILDFQDGDFYCGVTYESDEEKIKSNYSVSVNEDMFIKTCKEKPLTVFNKLKGTGFCIFNKSTLSFLKNTYVEKDNTPDNLCDFINLLIGNNFTGKAFCVAEKEFNINTAEDLQEAIIFLS